MAPGRHLGHRGRDVGGAVARQHDAGDPGALRAAQQRRRGCAGRSRRRARAGTGPRPGAGPAQVVELDLLERPGHGPGPPGARRCGRSCRAGPGHEHEPARRRRAASRSISSICGDGSRSSAIQTSRTGRRPAASSSRTAWRPSTWSPPSPCRPPAPVRAGRPPVATRRPDPRPARRAPARGPGRAAAGWRPGGAGPRRRRGGPAHGAPAASRTTARQAMPSTRPRAPRPSARLALTLTGAPSTAPRPPGHLVGVLGQAGALAHHGAVGVHEAHALRRAPCDDTWPGGPWSRRRPRPGRSSGKWRPRSPRPAAPSRASARAWATTSASLWPARPAAPGMVTPPRTRGRPGSPEKRWTSKPWPTRSAPDRVGRRSRRRQRPGHVEVGRPWSP